MPDLLGSAGLRHGRWFGAAGYAARDEERGSKVSVAVIKDFQSFQWSVQDLTSESVGAWEPSFDSELWKERRILSLFVQNAAQVDGEGIAQRPAEPVRVLDWEGFQ